MTNEQNSSQVLPVLTAWTPAPGYDPAAEFSITREQAAECDRRMRALAIHIANWRMPGIFQALLEAGARMVAVAPEIFEVVMSDGQHRRVPDIEAHLNLVPWREPHENIH